MPEFPTFLTVIQVAEILNCSESHVRNLIDRGVLDEHRIGGKVSVTDRDLASFIEASKSVKPIRKAERRPLFRRPPPGLDHLT